MSTTFLVVLIIIGVVCLVWLWKVFKPYFIKYDTTVLFTGGLGSGKSLESVKTSIVLIRKQRFYKYKVPNFFEKRIKRPFKYFFNILKVRYKREYIKKTWLLRKNRNQYNEFNYKFADRYFVKIIKKKNIIKHRKILEYKKLRSKPMLYSNMPIHYKTHIFSRKREWAKIITPKHIFLIKRIREYSVVLIDEFPQFINQFEWDNEVVQDNANEFITLFRHYIGGFLIINAQSESDIVVQFRRKLNQAIWCFDFKKHLFGLFYTNKMCDIMLSDNVGTMATTQIEENTKVHFGLFPPRNTYDTRCYSVRYNNVLEKNIMAEEEHEKLKTTRILRAKEYISPLDDDTTETQKESMKAKIERLERK